MRVEGVQYECARCGKKEFVPWDAFSHKYPDREAGQWVTIDSETHLCPECGEEYHRVMNKLLHKNV